MQTKTPYIINILDFVDTLATVSAEIIRPYFMQQNLLVESKEDGSPVTQADRAAEKKLRELIKEKYPEHGIIGEEFGSENENAEFVWVLDPIDGTKSFASGCPLFGTLICVLYQGVPTIGVINLPLLNQCFIGDGMQTWRNGNLVTMRKVSSLSDATLLYTDFLNVGEYASQANFERLARSVKMHRSWGDCYGYTLLAAGWADIMLDPIMNPWDVAPIGPIIEGAGGVVTDWQGNSVVNANSCVAVAPNLHEEVIALLNKE